MNEQEIKAFAERFPAIKNVEVNNDVVYLYCVGTLPQGFFDDAEAIGLHPVGAGGIEHEYDYRIILRAN